MLKASRPSASARASAASSTRDRLSGARRDVGCLFTELDKCTPYTLQSRPDVYTVHPDEGDPVTAPPYPLQLEGELDERPRRGLWLLKWLFGIPHFVVLLFLWIAFAATTVF